MKIAILNDTHCGARNSAEWMIDYQERFYNEVFFPYLLEHDIKQIIHAGDYFENRKTAASVQAIESNKKVFVNKLDEYDMGVHVIPGNHDVFYKNTNKLTSLTTHLAYTENYNYGGRIVPVFEPEEYYSSNVCLIPWVNEENVEEVRKFIKKTKANICIGHFEFEGFPFQKEGSPCLESAQGLKPDELAKFDMVLSGHFHTKSKKGNIQYLGSQLEFTWADYDDPKYFHILDTETLELTPVRNPITLFEKINLSEALEKDKSFFNKKICQIIIDVEVPQKKKDKLINDIMTTSISVSMVEQNKFNRGDVDVDLAKVSDTLSLIKTYIDEADTNSLNKDTLKALSEKLYYASINT